MTIIARMLFDKPLLLLSDIGICRTNLDKLCLVKKANNQASGFEKLYSRTHTLQRVAKLNFPQFVCLLGVLIKMKSRKVAGSRFL